LLTFGLLFVACSDDEPAEPTTTSTATSASNGSTGTGGSPGTGGGGGDATGDVFVVAVGEQGAILHCNGDACEAVESPVTTELDAVVVRSADEAYAVGAQGVALAWDGRSWKEMAVPTNASLLTLAAMDDVTLFAGGEDGLILRYDGTAWTEVANPMSGTEGFWITGLSFAGPSFGLASGGELLGNLDGVLLRWDGTTWAVERENLDSHLDCVAVASEALAAAGGFATAGESLNLLTRDEGGAWTRVSDIPERNFVTGVSFASETFGIAVTDAEVLGAVPPAMVFWDGALWTAEDHVEPMTQVHVIDDTLAFVVGWTDDEGPFVERWERGQLTRLPAPDVTTALWSVHGVRLP
jgi:photosystem II stability/assembly factor-like uncharacterized protein